MKITVKECSNEGRVIIVSSEAYRFAYSEGICFDKSNDE
jgi:WW domain-containing oxidoreductase